MNATSWLAFLMMGSLASALPGATGGDDPNHPPRPDRSPTTDRRPDGPSRSRMEWWRDRGGNQIKEPSQEEQKQIAEFMTTYSPKRWARVQEVTDEDKRTRITNFIAMRWRMMERLKKDEPRTYDVRLKRLQIEDEVFDLGWTLTHPNDDIKIEEVRSKLREQVKALVNNGLEERKLRLEQLQVKLDLDRIRLKEDEADRETMVDKQMTEIENERWPMMGDLLPSRGSRGSGRPDRSGGPATAPTTRSSPDEQ